jgi:hypothetical protein
MNKFKFSFKITGLEMQVEGTREDVGTITNSISQQFKGLIQPAGSLGNETIENSTLAITEEGEITEVTSKKPKRKNRSSQPKGDKAKALDFKNNPAKYGSPIQGWTTLDKAIWLLYVVQSELQVTELSAGEVAETFNKHFKQSGTIRASNISRDFGKSKSGAKALVGENVTKFPAKWYLTEVGIKEAQKIIETLKTSK